MTTLFKILNLLNFDMPEITSHHNGKFMQEYENPYPIEYYDHLISKQQAYTNLNTEITDKFIINDFGNLNGFNDNIQLPFIYLDQYSLHAMGTALPDF